MSGAHPSAASDPVFDWRALWAIARQRPGALWGAQVLAVLATAVSVPIPLLFPLLVDEVLLRRPGPAVSLMDRVLPPSWQGPLGYVLLALGATLLLRLLALLASVLQARQFAVVSGEILYRLRRAALERLERSAVSELEARGPGGLAAHLITDVQTIGGFIESSVSRFVINALTVAGVAAVLLWMHWRLALFILLLNPVVVYFTVALGRRVKTLKQQENSAVAAFQDALTETLGAIRQVRASNRDAYFLARLLTAAREVRDHGVRYTWKSYAANRGSFVVFLLGFDLFRALALLAVLGSDLTIGRMFAVFNYLWYGMGPVQELLGIHYSFFAAQGALARINGVLRLAEEERPIGPLDDPFARSDTTGISVRGLAVDYGAGRAVLRGIDLEVAPGEKVGLVGASGGGKSTFSLALLGLAPRTAGTIAYAGLPVERIGWETVREHVAAVLQHPALFNDSVRFNITLGRPSSEAALWRALETAQLAQEIAALPLGLETTVGQQGARLSGGQRQRLAIARMLLAAPRVVILDEATSALDLETEDRLYHGLMGALASKTVLVIAHRLSTLRFVDRVLVFEDGRVAEQGSHESLLAGGGLYAALHAKR
ncbi:MAG TPA: ABC transporter ATP-binding protein [Thermoanaerobaculia bacterium]|nr:ABC transporter ATP-binding protein [Thermoanaerobaculia bacterium]